MTHRVSCALKILASTAAITLAVFAVSCVTEDEDPAGTGGTSAGGSGGSTTGGSSGSGGGTATGGGAGGDTTTGGTTSTGGAGEGGASGGATDAVACATPSAPEITDFTYVEADPPTPDQVTFGDFTDTFSGGTLYYPDTLTSDVTTGVWHISGSVEDYAGFGLFFSVPTGGCSKVDASAFRGISFSISGTLPAERELTMWVSTAGNQISDAWFASQTPPVAVETPTFGRCAPTSNRYDSTCKDPTYPITLSATPTTVQVLWSDLTGGAPAESPDPAEITGIGWYLSWGGASDMPYDIDITIDDLTFIE